MTKLEATFNALSEDTKERLLLRFGGDCFADIEEELTNWYLYMHGKQANRA